MPVALPAKSSVEGAVARLLLAEARSPGNPRYVMSESLQSMQWMKLVLNNRLNNNPKQFLAPNAKTLVDIIRARGQFAGFDNYPAYDSDIADRLQSYLDIANSTKDKRSGAYTEFVLNALQVARAPVIDDPSTAGNADVLGLFAWKTAGATPPGDRFSTYRDLAGNSFYTLSR